MKAIEILHNYPSKTRMYSIYPRSECDEAIEEIETLQQELKQGQDNFNKLWDLYSELKRENRVLQEYINETKDCGSCKIQRAIKIWDERKINEKL